MPQPVSALRGISLAPLHYHNETELVFEHCFLETMMIYENAVLRPIL